MTQPLSQIAQLSPEKRELLLQRLRAKTRSVPAPLQPQPRQSNRFPLSFAQERLWFFQQWEPESAAYNIPAAVHLRGELDAAVLEQSLNQLVQRHEVLRSRLVMDQGQPVQEIQPEMPLTLAIADFRALPLDQRQPQAEQLLRQEACLPFDLERGPLLRALLVRLEENEAIALLTMHHIVSDGWSRGILVRELAACYRAYQQGQPIDTVLPELPIQYADFAVWQRQWLQGEVLEAQRRYWREQLSGTPMMLELPTDRPRPAVQSDRGATQTFWIAPDLAQGLKTLSLQTGATLFMTLLAAFKVLLYRYTGQTDLWIGTPIANRNRGEIEGLIGFFVNTLVLRTQISGELTFRQFLQQVRQVALAAYEHQDFPFEQLVEDLQVERDPSRHPLFQVLFVLQNAPMQPLELPGLTLTPLQIDSQTANFDLTLSIVETATGLRASLEYNTDLFDPATIARLQTHFLVLLEGIRANPDQSLSTLPLLSDTERRQVLLEWNASPLGSQPIATTTLHELIQSRVAATPTAIALVWGQQEFTYAALNQQANQLAHWLQQAGVGPEVRVGVCLERSPALVVTVLAILKAGGAYVPLDPSYPRDRLMFMLQDAEVAALVTQTSCLEAVTGDLTQLPARIIDLDLEADLIQQQSPANPLSAATATNLAYVIYTSGSTGQAKGVMVEHRNLIHAYLGWEQAYQLRSPVQRHLQMASFSFDVFAGDLVRALGSGGTLVLCPREFLLEPQQLYTLIQEQRIECAEFVPAVLRLLIQNLSARQQRLDGLKLLICGSDSWTMSEYHQFQACCGPQTRLINSFGVTEATIDSSYFELPADPGAEAELTQPDLAAEQWVPIGRPFPGTQLYILDAQLQPVPIGVTGELYIGGAGVARGYWKRPELTAEKFIVNPFGGDRLYRTGDLARYLPDGNIQFLGRFDDQVKLRGYRIELGEIVALLTQHPTVQDGVAIARTDASGHQHLVAYVIPQHPPSFQVQALRQWLAQQLPAYMVPTAFVVLEQLPLTPNGKIDRRALPAPTSSDIQTQEGFVPPRTALEQTLAHLWRQVLQVSPIGIYDHFFALGGHSLLATQLMSRLRERFRIELPLQTLFERPTIATLAPAITTALASEPTSLLRSLQSVERTTPLPLSFGQQRLWFLAQLEPESAAYHIPVPVRLQGELNLAALEQSLNAVIQRHEILRTRFAMPYGRSETIADNQPIQIIQPELAVKLAVVDLRQFPPDQRRLQAEALLLQESRRPFDLTQGPLLRALVVQLEAAEHLALLTLHHIITDGWSMGILLRELAVCYTACLRGETPQTQLAALPLQYADFACWQRQWLQGVGLETQRQYWRQQLSGPIPVLELPTDRPRPTLPRDCGATHEFVIDLDLSRALKNLSQEAGATLFMTLLAAFKVLLYRYTGQTDLWIGTPIANRNRAELEGLIGFLVNTLVLRIQISGEPTFREFLQQVRQVALEAYEHQDFPFEQLVEELQVERDLGRNPLFQVMFLLQNAPLEPLELPGLTLESLTIERQTANFDLTLAIAETPTGLKANLEYRTDLFDAATLSRMAGHFHRLLAGIVANPDQTLGNLPLLTVAERQQILVDWNSTPVPPLAVASIQQLFEAQAERTPEAIAVIYQDQRLTYQDLNHRANQLARHLQTLGVQPGDRVGLCVERSPVMVIGLFAILKAGAAYVPLDPTYPGERLAGMLADAQVAVLLTQGSLLTTLPLSQALPGVCLDRIWPSLAEVSPANLTLPFSPEDPAYVIYTSGSTGQPKGVLVPQRALVNFAQAAIAAYGIGPDDVVLQFASISFDAAAEEIFPALVQGATLVLRTGEMLRSIPGFLADCQQFRLTVLDLPTAFWQQLTTELATSSLALPSTLRLVIIGGEAAPIATVLTWQQRVGSQVRLINSYGPTETTVVATLAELTDRGAELLRYPVVPIGRAIANVQTYVLDAQLQPVPVGIPGELYIGGAGVAQGYWNRPELTAEKFIPDPFGRDLSFIPGPSSLVTGQSPPTPPPPHSPTPNHLYKTGDRVRWLANGELAFLGRIDDQIKLRGYRIEPGEIASRLQHHAAVAEALVVAPEDAAGQRQLVAYLIPSREGAMVSDRPTGRSWATPTAIAPPELRRWLQTQLPPYMIPSAFVWLQEFPLTPNGKVDRRALPAPTPTRSDLDSGFVAPRTELEHTLAQLWSQILQLPAIGIHDNFFELGGHSLLTTQLLLRLRQTFAVELPLSALFATPTIAGLASQIEQQRQAQSCSPIENSAVLEQLQADALLAPELFPALPRVEPRFPPQQILLTGATGFLGAFLLFELLQQTPATLYCLVRSPDAATGWHKLRQTLESYQLWQPRFRDRIVVIPGDLAQPALGLTPALWQQLASEIHTIYHNGAWVHHLYPYSVLRAANVLGTAAILRLACEAQPKPVHFISTPSVFSGVGQLGIQQVREQDALGDRPFSDNGYVQTKWVGEKLVMAARERGLPVSIYRPGRISGHSQTGVFNQNDLLYKLIIGCCHLGSVPDRDIREDILPIDYVSQAIAHLSLQPASVGQAFHLIHTQRLHTQQLLTVLHSLGYALGQVPYPQWQAELLQTVGQNPDHPLYPLVPFFADAPQDTTATSKSELQFDAQNTAAGLAGTAIAPPAIDERLLTTYCTYLHRHGFLN